MEEQQVSEENIATKPLLSPTLPKWWRVLPTLIIIVIISNIDTLLLNDFIEYRYTSQYQLNSSKTSSSRELCLNTTRTSHDSTHIVSTTTSKNPLSTTMSPNDRVQAATASLNVYISLVSTIPAILTSILLGSNCDRIGRRSLLVLPYFGKVFRYIILTAVVYFKLSNTWILIALLLDSVFGTSGLSILSSFAYISDCTTKKTRTLAIIITDVCMGGGRLSYYWVWASIWSNLDLCNQ